MNIAPWAAEQTFTIPSPYLFLHHPLADPGRHALSSYLYSLRGSSSKKSHIIITFYVPSMCSLYAVGGCRDRQFFRSLQPQKIYNYFAARNHHLHRVGSLTLKGAARAGKSYGSGNSLGGISANTEGGRRGEAWWVDLILIIIVKT